MRLRLLAFKRKLDLHSFMDNIGSSRFKLGESDKRFSLYQVGNLGFKASYTESIKYKSLIVNSSGEEEEVDLVRRVTFEFNVYLRGDYFIFVIFDAPRSISSFVDEIYNICDGKIYHKLINLNLRKFYKFIESDTGYFIYKIPSIQVSDVSLNNSSSAIIRVASSKNSMIDLEKFIDGKNYTLKKLTLHCDFGVFSSPIEATSSGAFKMSFDTFEILEEKLVSYVFSTL